MFRQFIEYVKIRRILDQPKRLQAIQEKRLQHIISRAYEIIPFYKNLMDKHNISVHDIKTVKDLEKLPIINKNKLKRSKKAIVSKSYKKRDFIRERTSGSSGTPFAVYRTKEVKYIETAENELLVYIFDIFFGIQWFRVYQRKDTSLLVEIELEKGRNISEEKLIKRIKKYTKGLEATIKYVKDWNLKPREKFHLFTKL